MMLTECLIMHFQGYSAFRITRVSGIEEQKNETTPRQTRTWTLQLLIGPILMYFSWVFLQK